MMWRELLSFTLCFFICAQLSSGSVGAAEDELEAQVKIEVLFRPEVCSPKGKKGDLMNAHYDGFVAEDGSQFYCSRSDKAGHPQWFVLGVGQVIKDPVPPNATVVFEVEVYSVSQGPRSLEAFRRMDLDHDKSLTKDEIRKYLKKEYEKGGKPRDEPFYEKIMADIIRKNDVDKDGTISMKEYNIYEHDEL